MDLILWRHAEAGEADESGDDLQRPLTSRGERQAAKVAAWLNQHLPATARVLASPAMRTRQTAAALERRVKIVESIGPGATARAVLDAAHWPVSKEPVLVVGHQPTLGHVASLLLAGQEQGWSVKKGAVWWLRSRDRERAGQVVLVAVRGPDSL